MSVIKLTPKDTETFDQRIKSVEDDMVALQEDYNHGKADYEPYNIRLSDAETNSANAVDTANNAVNTANSAMGKVTTNENKINNLFNAPSGKDLELTDIRYDSVNDIQYNSVGERVNNITSELNDIPNQAYITEKAKQVDLNATNTRVTNVETNKRDKAVKINNGDLDTSSDANKIKLINLSDEVKQAMAGTTPINASVADLSIGTTKLADEAITPSKMKASAKTGILSCLSGIPSLDIINDTLTFPSGEKAFLVGSSSYDFTTNSVTIDMKNATVGSYYAIIYFNVVTKAFSVTPRDTPPADADNCIRVATYNNGSKTFNCNFEYTSSKINNAITSNVAIQKNNLAIFPNNVLDYDVEEDTTNAKMYIYVGTLCVRNGTTLTLQWADIKTSINDITRFVTTPKGKVDYMRIEDGESFCFDALTNTFKIIPYQQNSYNHIIIAYCWYGRLLKGIILDDINMKNTRNINTISNSNISVLADKVAMYPSYYNSHLSSVITKANTYLNQAGFNNATLLTLNDIHHQGAFAKYLGSMLGYIDSSNKLPHIINTGDTVFDAYTESHLADFQKWFGSMKNKVMNTVGNHDANSVPVGVTSKDFCHYLINNFREGLVFNDGHENDCYYYYDDIKAKIRYISINLHVALTIAPTIDQVQLQWLINTALKAPSGWGYIIFSHEPLKNEGLTGVSYEPTNGVFLLNLLDALNTKVAFTGTDSFSNNYNIDFSSTNNYVIATLAGHTHTDNLVKHNTINIITTLAFENDASEAGTPTRTLGTITEMAMDLYVINKEARTGNIIRIGAGSDRSFTY